mmetsp:Transcript_19634/g.54747  ORF Transcript_19634/g.54747 Transcript_19634/m.54747 type:complete len:157 (+) Transcript_19634:258-728(+)
MPRSYAADWSKVHTKLPQNCHFHTQHGSDLAMPQSRYFLFAATITPAVQIQAATVETHSLGNARCHSLLCHNFPSDPPLNIYSSLQLNTRRQIFLHPESSKSGYCYRKIQATVQDAQPQSTGCGWLAMGERCSSTSMISVWFGRAVVGPLEYNCGR